MRGMTRLTLLGVPGPRGESSAPVAPALAAILSTFEGAGDEVGIYKSIPYIGSTVYTYHLMQSLGGGRYVDRTFLHAAEGETFTRAATTEVGKLLWWVNDNDAGLTKSGSWNRIAHTDYLGGGYSYTETVGGYVEWTTAANVTHLGAWGLALGVALVTIDGDTTLANKLPTAQDLVDAETLADTVLVANGGTLNPTDRVWNMKASDLAYTELVDNLTPGAHTLRLTCTGYKQADAMQFWLGFSALAQWGATAGFDLDTAYFYFLREQYVRSTTSVDEISYNHQPEGTSVTEWIGHSNWLLQKTPVVVTIDGTETALDTYQRASSVIAPSRGSTIKITFQADARHPEMGATNTALLDMEYRVEAAAGYFVKHRTTWLTNGITTGTHPAMLGYEVGEFDRCAALDSVADVPIVQDGRNDKCDTTTAAMWIWKTTGNVGALFHTPNLTTLKVTWPNFYQSLRDDGVAKLYSHLALGAIYSTNDTWDAETNYRFQWFPGGAHAALSVE